jgi:hypothetical protein
MPIPDMPIPDMPISWRKYLWMRGMYRYMHFSDDVHDITLWYVSVPMEQLLADIEAIGRGLHGTTGMRVFTDHEEAVTVVPALCAAHGYACELAPYSSDELREGDQRPYGRYCFFIRNP